MESNLIQHAKFEIERAGLNDKDADYDGAVAKSVMDLIQVFSDQHHSGMSASYVLGVFDKLARFDVLSPLTDNPDEWQEICDETTEEHGTRTLYQNRRRGSTFSWDRGKTWYDIEDKSRDNGDTWPGWEMMEEGE